MDIDELFGSASKDNAPGPKRQRADTGDAVYEPLPEARAAQEREAAVLRAVRKRFRLPCRGRGRESAARHVCASEAIFHTRFIQSRNRVLLNDAVQQ